MPISLNHTIVSAADSERAARFFATVMGLEYTGPDRHFAPVRVNESLTLDFLTVPSPPAAISPSTSTRPLSTRYSPAPGRRHPVRKRPGHPRQRPDRPPAVPPRSLFADDSENLYELMSPA
ncbi:VOC family protein [Streptomyces sp. V1I1]|uniref:VOC family protein n=1 Tax=Streptomyces sp. V1I1 TaxID=3042272 RepID=UPI00277FEAB5|nr:VOC family protein [Streptomyces sp. V1I1]MDQ0942194.1 hypothetical protein [Streptomyces sp. V1I1]